MLLIVALAACTGAPSSPPPVDTGAVDTADTGDVDTDTEATDTGTDADNDGWTVEEGDCDDDEPWRNPGMPERPQDGLDNDCDGLVDETFDGVLVVQGHAQGAETTAVHAIDPLGDIDTTWSLAGGPAAQALPAWLDARLDRTGWMATDGGTGSVYRIDDDGTASLTWSAATDTGLSDDDVPEALWGVASHPGGWTAVTSGPALYRIDDDGTATLLARWTALEEGHAIYAAALTANPLTGAITLFGTFGGVATWTTDDGFAVVVPEDPDQPTGQFLDAHSDEAGEVFALGTTGAGTGVFAWDGASLELVGPWIDSAGDPIDFPPRALALDTEGGDFYVSANAGWKRTVWRVFADDGFASPLYPHPDELDDVPGPAEEFRRFLGLAIRWEEAP